MSTFESVKKIYEALWDEHSKQIFQDRLNYSLTGNWRYIDEMVLREMERYGHEDIVNRLLDWIGNGGVWIFGAGFAGSQIVHILMLKKKKIDGIVDNNEKKQGRNCYGVLVSSPDVLLHGARVVIGTNNYCEEIKRQLLSLGIREKDIFMPDGLWWLGRDPQYYDRDIMKPVSHEVFIDGGSLDGGDSLNFAKWCADEYEKIYAFEPDVSNLQKMNSLKERLHDFNICSVGLWSKRDVLKFSSGVGENCLISDDGDTEVRVTSIDEVLNGRPATYIKMDIEGSESEALTGTKETIWKYKPRLAICVYHKPEDIIDIPKLILELNPDYKLFLRHYSYLDTETVLYAI